LCGHGVSILPKLILKRILYKIITKELDIPAYRNIGLAVRNKKSFIGGKKIYRILAIQITNILRF